MLTNAQNSTLWISQEGGTGTGDGQVAISSYPPLVTTNFLETGLVMTGDWTED